jgi:hypothetical protein
VASPQYRDIRASDALEAFYSREEIVANIARMLREAGADAAAALDFAYDIVRGGPALVGGASAAAADVARHGPGMRNIGAFGIGAQEGIESIRGIPAAGPLLADLEESITGIRQRARTGAGRPAEYTLPEIIMSMALPGGPGGKGPTDEMEELLEGLARRRETYDTPEELVQAIHDVRAARKSFLGRTQPDPGTGIAGGGQQGWGSPGAPDLGPPAARTMQVTRTPEQPPGSVRGLAEEDVTRARMERGGQQRVIEDVLDDMLEELLREGEIERITPVKRTALKEAFPPERGGYGVAGDADQIRGRERAEAIEDVGTPPSLGGQPERRLSPERRREGLARAEAADRAAGLQSILDAPIRDVARDVGLGPGTVAAHEDIVRRFGLYSDEMDAFYRSRDISSDQASRLESRYGLVDAGTRRRRPSPEVDEEEIRRAEEEATAAQGDELFGDAPRTAGERAQRLFDDFREWLEVDDPPVNEIPETIRDAFEGEDPAVVVQLAHLLRGAGYTNEVREAQRLRRGLRRSEENAATRALEEAAPPRRRTREGDDSVRMGTPSTGTVDNITEEVFEELADAGASGRDPALGEITRRHADYIANAPGINISRLIRQLDEGLPDDAEFIGAYEALEFARPTDRSGGVSGRVNALASEATTLVRRAEGSGRDSPLLDDIAFLIQGTDETNLARINDFMEGTARGHPSWDQDVVDFVTGWVDTARRRWAERIRRRRPIRDTEEME